VIHVEQADGGTFCGWSTQSDDGAVMGYDWRTEPEAIQRATCEQCLLRIFMLGDSAQIALARMGRKIEVRNAPAETISS
jgi:hypothetical protein